MNASVMLLRESLDKLNEDKNAYRIAKRRAEEAQRQRDEIRGATREINNLKCEMHEIKDMLKKVLDKNGN